MRQYLVVMLLVVLAIQTAFANGPDAPPATKMADFLPTKSAATDAFIASVKSWAQDQQRQYGVNASVAIAQAAVESGWGKYAVDNTYFNMRYPSGDPYTTGGVTFGSSGPWCKYVSGAEAFLGYGWLITHGSYFTGVNGNHIDCRNDLGNAYQLMYDIAYDGYCGGPGASQSVFADYYNLCVGIITNYNLTQYDLVITPPSLTPPCWAVTQQTDGILTIKDSPGGTTIDRNLSDGVKLHLVEGPVRASNNLYYYRFDYNDGGKSNGWVGYEQLYQGNYYCYLTPTTPVQFSVNASAGEHGSVSPGGNIDYGSRITFTAAPDNGYQVDKWMEGSSVLQTGGNSLVVDNVVASRTLTVVFKALQYTVTASAGANGSINPSGAVVKNSGEALTLTATPQTGFVVDQWLLDDTPVQDGATSYTLSDITANHTVYVTFTAAPLESPLGDLNHDNLVNEDDADLVLQYLAGEQPALEAAIKELATKVNLPSAPVDARVALWILNHPESTKMQSLTHTPTKTATPTKAK